jgi:peroxiredoxin family protein
MKLGILVTTDRHLGQIRGITEAALAKGHTVAIFATDEGTKLLANQQFSSLSALAGVTMNYCDHSAARHGGRPAALPAAIAQGSQFENAIMNSESDKVIVL